MGDGSGLSQMPPWGWGLLLLGSGGGIGTLSGLNMSTPEDCMSAADVAKLESDLVSARAGLTAANATIQSLIEVIKDNNNSGWIE